jgi:hypothetical protein
MRREAERFYGTMVLANRAGALPRRAGGRYEAVLERAVLVEGRVHQSTMAAQGSVTYPHKSARIVGPETIAQVNAIIEALEISTSLKGCVRRAGRIDLDRSDRWQILKRQ